MKRDKVDTDQHEVSMNRDKPMTEREMFEKSFGRPKNFFKLTERERWNIDSDLGILDWIGLGMTAEDLERFQKHYE